MVDNFFVIQVAKKRDKQERKILDSQERAFWDVYRPPPGQVNTTEMDIKKMYKLSAIFGQEQAMVGTEKTEHSQLRRELAALQVSYEESYIQSLHRSRNREIEMLCIQCEIW